MQKVVLLGLAIVLSLSIITSSSLAASDAPPQEWDKLTITSNSSIKSEKYGLTYAQHLKDKAKK